MKQPELFHKTIGILVRAYFEGTLSHQNYSTCAVGNLVCANMFDNDFRRWDNYWDRQADNGGNWNNVFVTDRLKYQRVNPQGLAVIEIKKQIDSTGYYWEDLAKIEFAFENTPCDRSKDARMFSGLMSVCDTLMQIHEATEEEVNEAKGMFVR